MSDSIAHLQNRVNRNVNAEHRELSAYPSSPTMASPAISDRQPHHIAAPTQDACQARKLGGRSSKDRGSVSERALESRLAAGPPHQDPQPKRRRRAPHQMRTGRPPYWLSTAIHEAVRLIKDRGPVHQVAAFRQVFEPILALHIMRERANPEALLDAGVAAAWQARQLVRAEVAAECEAWVRTHLAALRGVEAYRLWRAAGARSRRGGFKELGASLGQHFSLTQAERQRLKVRMIRAVDVTPGKQREAKRNADRARAAAKRRAAGVKQRVAPDAVAALMRETGLSRASCYRRLQTKRATETGHGATSQRNEPEAPNNFHVFTKHLSDIWVHFLQH